MNTRTDSTKLAKLQELDSLLPREIRGQSHALPRIISVVRRGELSLTKPSRPRGSFLLRVWCLRNHYTFAAMDFGRRLGASDEHIPKWICKERATTPPPKRHAALRVALKLAWGFVAQSVEYRWGIHSLPRASPQANLSATNV